MVEVALAADLLCHGAVIVRSDRGLSMTVHDSDLSCTVLRPEKTPLGVFLGTDLTSKARRESKMSMPYYDNLRRNRYP